MSKKIVLGFFKICKYAFFKYLKKCMSKKIELGFFKDFVNILFNVIIFSMNGGYRDIQGLYVCFYKNLLFLKKLLLQKGLYKY